MNISPGQRCPACGRSYSTRQRWSKEAIVDAVHEWVHRYGRLPIANEWKTQPSMEFPTQHSVRNHFGTWNAAMEAAGFDPRPHGSQIGVRGHKLGRNRQVVTGGRRTPKGTKLERAA